MNTGPGVSFTSSPHNSLYQPDKTISKLVSSERGMNPVTMTTINPWKEIDQGWDENNDLFSSHIGY